MTSQVSIRKLLLQEIRQNGWMFGLTMLMHFLTGPVVFLLNTANYANWTKLNAANRFQDFFTEVFFIWQVFVIIGCICISIFTYKYLFSKRMVDLYHSVPISRGQLFLVKYLHGLLIWLIPFVINVLSVFLLFVIRTFGKAYLLSCLGTLVKSVLLLLLCFFIFYHLFLTAVYLSGNVLNMFTNTVIIGCSLLGFIALYFSYCNTYFDTYCGSASILLMDIAYSLSPFTTPFAIMAYYASGELSEHIPLLALSIPVSFGLLGTAWILCQKRPSELAERGTISKRYIMASRIAVALLAGLSGSLFFSEIAYNNGTLAWGIFGAILCSILSFGALTSIYRTTIKFFFKNKKQMALTMLVSTCMVLIFQLDIFGYDSFIPDKEDIAGMAVYTSSLTDDSSHLTMEGGNISYNRNSYVSQTDLFTDQDTCYALLDLLNTADTSDGAVSLYTKIKLKNGYTYERRYRLPYDQYMVLAPFVETESFKQNNYKFCTGLLGYPATLDVELWNASFEIKGVRIQELLDAYYADFNEHYSLDHLSSHMRLFRISGTYPEGIGYRHFDLDVPLEYTRTIDLLTQWYPEYATAPASADQIQALNINLYSYNKYDDYNYSLDTLYEEFGYPAESSESTETEETNTNQESTVVIQENGVTVEAVKEYYGNPFYTIQDKETIAKLFPLLTLGSYRDAFNRDEYLYLGEAVFNNQSINCYVKPATLPKEFLQEIYENTKGNIKP